MESGYLGILSNHEHPNKIQIKQWNDLPDSDSSQTPYGDNIRYIAWFNDILTGGLHTHSGLRKTLVDANNHLYSADITEAIAVIESNGDLRHKQIWIDPKLKKEELARIETLSKQKRNQRKLKNKIIQVVGFIGIAMLALGFFSSLG